MVARAKSLFNIHVRHLLMELGYILLLILSVLLVCVRKRK